MANIQNNINNIVPANNFTINNGNLYTDSISFNSGANIMNEFVNAGSFTPTLFWTNTQNATSAASGVYYKINQFVFVTIQIQFTSSGASGSMNIRGLPIAANSSYQNYFGNAIYFRGSGVVSGFYDTFGLVFGNSINIYYLASGLPTAASHSNFSTGQTTFLYFTTTYVAAS